MPMRTACVSEHELASLEHFQARLLELEQGVAAGAGLTRRLAETERQHVYASERSRGFAELLTSAHAAAAASGRDDLKFNRIEETLQILLITSTVASQPPSAWNGSDLMLRDTFAIVASNWRESERSNKKSSSSNSS